MKLSEEGNNVDERRGRGRRRHNKGKQETQSWFFAKFNNIDKSWLKGQRTKEGRPPQLKSETIKETLLQFCRLFKKDYKRLFHK